MIPCNHSLIRVIRVLNDRDYLPEGTDAEALIAIVVEHLPDGGGLSSPCVADTEPWPCSAYREVMAIVGPARRRWIKEAGARVRARRSAAEAEGARK